MSTPPSGEHVPQSMCGPAAAQVSSPALLQSCSVAGGNPQWATRDHTSFFPPWTKREGLHKQSLIANPHRPPQGAADLSLNHLSSGNLGRDAGRGLQGRVQRRWGLFPDPDFTEVLLSYRLGMWFEKDKNRKSWGVLLTCLRSDSLFHLFFFFQNIAYWEQGFIQTL